MRIVVEGRSDEEAARKVVMYCGHDVTSLRSAGGKSRLDEKIPKYAQAACYGHEPWVVFRDSDNECPVALRDRLLAGVRVHELFALRIAHTMTEAWLMADRQRFADYFKVTVNDLPVEPEKEVHAKRTLLRVCLSSRSRDIREGVAHDGHHPGPLFGEHLNDFAKTAWDVGTSAESSPSLRRAIAAICSIPREPPMS